MNKNMKFLVVDNFSAKRRFTKNLLKSLGYMNIQETDDGNTALSMVTQDDFDFVVTNYFMPGMDGIDLFKAIRANPSLEHMAVLMVAEETKKEQIIARLKPVWMAILLNLSQLRHLTKNWNIYLEEGDKTG